MCQRKQWEINFEVKRTEVYTFVMKPGDCGYSPEDEHAEQTDWTLGNVGCILRFPNNISSLLATTIANNDDNQNIVGSVNYTVPQPHS